MCKIEIIKNEKVLKVPKATYSGNYLSTELISVVQKITGKTNIPANWITEYCMRKVLGLSTKNFEIKEIIIK